MRSDNANFSEVNQNESQSPLFVVEIAFDDAYSDLIYLTSDTVTGLTGTVYTGVLESISGTTQRINPDKANSEIGALTFSAVDDGLTTKQREKLTAGLGLNGKRARFYVGDRSLSWSDFTLVQTQIIRDAQYKDRLYTWRCSDIQRALREDIFALKETRLAAALTVGATTVEVYSTTGFEMVQHPVSPTGKTDADGQKVGYLKVKAQDQIEIIRYTGKTATSFTGCTRGVLGTKPISIERDASEGADNAPKVEEYVYLEMPGPKLAYALLTGSIYGEAGEYLPDHWHLGIDAANIRTSDFLNIGADLWDLSDEDGGLPVRIQGVKKEDGKKFIEEELLLLMGCFPPIYANGEIGLRRMTGVLSDASPVRLLSDQNLVEYGSLRHDMGAVINRIIVSWNWVEQREAFTRKNLLIDQKSIDTHGESDLKELNFRGLHGSRHSSTRLQNMFDALRDRYAGPPLLLDLTLTPENNDLEVGDIVRVKLDAVEDYTGSITGIDRSFEVQQVKTDWVTGDVKVSLFGSSQKADAVADVPGGTGTQNLPNSLFAPAGAVEISAANFGSAVSSSGGVTTITGSITLAGNDDLRAAVYYCLEDLTIADTGVVTYTKNAQIRVKGFFQNNGSLTGRGQGAAGSGRLPRREDYATYSDYTAALESYKNNHPQKFFGVSKSPSRPDVIATTSPGNDNHRYFRVLNPFYDSRFAVLGNPPEKPYATVAPALNLTVEGGVLKGLPSDLSGQPGIGCHDVEIQYDLLDPPVVYQGGSGGPAGAGLFIMAIGAEIGAGGTVNSSGRSGSYGAGTNASPKGVITDLGMSVMNPVGAAGAPGCVYWAIIGATSNPPTLNDSNAVAEYGSPIQDDKEAVTVSVKDFSGLGSKDLLVKDLTGTNVATVRQDQSAPTPYYQAVNVWKAAHRIQFLPVQSVDPVEDVPTYADKPASLILSEATNTPKSAKANLSTIEASVSSPSDPAFSYALVEYRVSGTTAWTEIGPASPEATVTVASDGTAYEFRARSVSTSGNVSEDYVQASITVTDVVNNPPPADVDPVAPLSAVTGLQVEGGGTTFTGRSAKIEWTDPNRQELHFKEYKVEILDGGSNILRTEKVSDPLYEYTEEKNAEDFQRQNATAGLNRSFTVRVTVLSWVNTSSGQHSSPSAQITVSNPAPALPTNLAVTAGYKLIRITFDPPTDLDYKETRVWSATTSGFAVSDANLVAVSYNGPVILANLADNTTYYVRLATFDAFGQGTLSSEFAVTTHDLADAGFGPWADLTTADRAFIDANVASGAVPSTKIENLVASKIVTGVLGATTLISVGDPATEPYTVNIGATALDGKVALLSMKQNSNGAKIFALNEDGTADFTGNVTITGGNTFTGTNHAKNATGLVSTLYNGGKAIGSAYDEWVGTPNYRQADIGSVKYIDESRLYWYAADGRTYQYAVAISRDGSTWNWVVGGGDSAGNVTTWATSRARIDGYSPNGVQLPTIDSISDVCRYVRVYGNGNTFNTSNHLYEWELWSAGPRVDPYLEALSNRSSIRNADQQWSQVSGAGRPEDNANRTDLNQAALGGASLIKNGDMTMVAVDGRPAGVKAGYSNGTTTTISYLDAAKTILKLHSASDSSIGCVLPAFRVKPGMKYGIFIRVKASASVTSGFYFRMQEYDGELPIGITHVCHSQDVANESGTVEDTRQITAFRENQPLTTAWEDHYWEYTPTSTAKWASPLFLNWVGMGYNELHVDVCHVFPLADSTEQALEMGTTMGAGFLNLTGTDARIRVGSNGWQLQGIQLEYNSGNPRFYVGDGADKFVKFESATGDLTIGRDVELKGTNSFNNSAIFFHKIDWVGELGASVSNLWGGSANITIAHKDSDGQLIGLLVGNGDHASNTAGWASRNVPKLLRAISWSDPLSVKAYTEFVTGVSTNFTGFGVGAAAPTTSASAGEALSDNGVYVYLKHNGTLSLSTRNTDTAATDYVHHSLPGSPSSWEGVVEWRLYPGDRIDFFVNDTFIGSTTNANALPSTAYGLVSPKISFLGYAYGAGSITAAYLGEFMLING